MPAKRITFPMRPSDGEPHRIEPHGGCRSDELICPRRVRSWPRGVEVDARPMGGREAPGLVKVTITLPRGIPGLHYNFIRTPIGLDVKEAKVGDADALAAIQDEVNFGDYDELIVSTLPRRLSKWLHVDLPRKAEAATGLPVLHITARAAKVPAS